MKSHAINTKKNEQNLQGLSFPRSFVSYDDVRVCRHLRLWSNSNFDRILPSKSPVSATTIVWSFSCFNEVTVFAFFDCGSLIVAESICTQFKDANSHVLREHCPTTNYRCVMARDARAQCAQIPEQISRMRNRYAWVYLSVPYIYYHTMV